MTSDMDNPASDAALPTLSRGFIQTINNDYDIANPPPAIVQILTTKSTESERGTRYKVIISDGQYLQQGILSSQLNTLVDSGDLTKNSVVQLKKFTVNATGEAKVIVVLDVDIMNNLVGQKIGNPVAFSGPSSSSSSSSSSTSSASSSTPSRPAPTSPFSKGSTSPSKSFPSPSSSPSKLRQPNFAPNFDQNKPPEIYPIAGLNPYQSRWAIKARVANKTDVKTWNNARGSGKLFSVDLIDDSGEIRATGFNETVDKFYDMLEVGKIFIFSRGTIKPAKKQYTSIKNDYELSFDFNTAIELAPDQNSAIPTIKYNFISIPKIGTVAKDTLVDVIGIVKEASEPTLTNTKNQRDLMKRDLVIVDSGLKSLKVTLWGTHAENFDASDFPVFAAKGIRVSDYGGCSLTSLSSSAIKINPDIAEAHTLRSWYDSVGKDSEFSSLSSGSSASTAFDDAGLRKMAKDVDLERLGGRLDGFDTYVIKGIVTNIPHERNFCYPACPDSGTKVTQDAQGWYSEKTKKYYPECDYKYIVKFQILDATGGLWLSGFNETGLTILNRPAIELVNMRDNGHADAFEDAFKSSLFKPYVFKVRSKSEKYLEEQYVRHQVTACKPLDYVNDAKFLLGAIAAYGK